MDGMTINHIVSIDHGSYMVTFTINIPPMLVYIPYMDPMDPMMNFVGHHMSPFFSSR